MKLSKILLLTISIIMMIAGPTPAQEPQLVSEIVARVNNDIITRGEYLSALRDLKEELVHQYPNKTEAELNVEYEKLKASVVDLMIDNLLLEQKAKELNVDVEADVNQQMQRLAADNHQPNQIAFENWLRGQGEDPDALRANLRKQFQQQYVMQKEVLAPIFQSVTEKERREFYEKNKEQFAIPGEVTLSEIFLPLEGRTASEVEQRARRLVDELRAGRDFAEAVQKNSPQNRPSRADKGKLGTFKNEELEKDLLASITNLKDGEITDPIRIQDGYRIIKMDLRKPASFRKYEDEEVQSVIGRAITMQKAETAQKKYVDTLREEAYILINKNYSPPEASAGK